MPNSYHVIDKESKKNVNMQAIPFCVERMTVPQTDKMHVHDYAQISVVIAGRAILSVNGSEVTVREGDVYFVESYAPHALRSPQKLEVINLLFYMDDLLKQSKGLREHPGFRELFMPVGGGVGQESTLRKVHFQYETLMFVLPIIQQMLYETEHGHIGAETMIQSCFLVLITQLVREREKSEEHRDREGNKLYRAVFYMEQHFTEAISLTELAKMSYLSERQFRRLFTQHYGISPTRHLQQLRINKARYLLRNTELNINEIAQSTGFVDSNYFTRLFKSETGIPPKQYRSDRQDFAEGE